MAVDNIDYRKNAYTRVRQILQDRRVSMTEMARDTGIPLHCFQDWQRGRLMPRRDRMQKIADYLGVSVEYITHGTPDISPAPSHLADYEMQLRIIDALRNLDGEDLAAVMAVVSALARHGGRSNVD